MQCSLVLDPRPLHLSTFPVRGTELGKVEGGRVLGFRPTEIVGQKVGLVLDRTCTPLPLTWGGARRRLPSHWSAHVRARTGRALRQELCTEVVCCPFRSLTSVSRTVCSGVKSEGKNLFTFFLRVGPLLPEVSLFLLFLSGVVGKGGPDLSSQTP